MTRAREAGFSPNRAGLVLLVLVMLGGWAGWCYVLTGYSPYAGTEAGPGTEAVLAPSREAWYLFFGTLAVALFATLSLVAYRMSFSMFASRLYRGNLARSCQHGLLWSAILVSAAVLRATKVLTLPASLALLGVLVLGEIVVLLRK